MSTIKCAAICDYCKRKSEEYTGWAICRECLQDTCDQCDVEAERNEEKNRTLCRQCKEEIDQEMDS